MKTIKIKGKDYIEVNERLKEFRGNPKYTGYTLESEMVSLTQDNCVIKAVIRNEQGNTVATGFAQEDRTSSMINKTSYVENCETSAWGRALANLGIGIDTSVASADEVDMAIKKQELDTEQEIVVGGEYKFTSGKYNGKTVQEVIDEGDVDYIAYCINAPKVAPFIKANLRKAIADNNIILESEVF